MNLILQRVDDSELIRRIDSANSSVALYAPGVSVEVARALHRAAWRLGGAIKVVLDVSQKSVDMGYLEPAAVEIIWKLQRDLGAQIFYEPEFPHEDVSVDEEKLSALRSVAQTFLWRIFGHKDDFDDDFIESLQLLEIDSIDAALQFSGELRKIDSAIYEIKKGNVAKLGMGFVPKVSGIDAFAA